MTPSDLARKARMQSKPTIADGQARQQARYLRTWWDHDRGMLHVRGELPDVLGEKFAKTLEKLTERMRSPKGTLFWLGLSLIGCGPSFSAAAWFIRRIK